MTNEEKRLLKRKDLSARLPYNVMVYIDGLGNGILTGIEGDRINTDRGINYPIHLCKPYLRPMLSMTDEEYVEYRKAGWGDTLDSAKALKQKAAGKCYISSWYRGTDWLLEHHFDYRGLIEKGLALEAPNGIYNS